MKKLFISQPMSGLSDSQIVEERERAYLKAKELINDDVKLINSFIFGVPADANPVWYLGESVKRLSEADEVYFVKGWDKSKGCKVEHLICELYNIKILYEEN